MSNTNYTEKTETKGLSGNNVTVLEMLEYVIALYGIKDVSEAMNRMNAELNKAD